MIHKLRTAPTREQQLQEELQVILDNAGVGICFIRNRVIQRCNRQFAMIYGYASPDQLTGHSSERLHPSAQSYRQLTFKAYPCLIKGERYTTELQMQRQNGSLFWGRMTGKLISPEQPRQGSIWIIEDIDQQRRADIALKTLHHQQQLILDHAMVGIAFMHQHRITRCNQRLAELTGYSMAELTQLGIGAFYRSEREWAEISERHARLLGRGEVFSTELQLLRADGSQLWCELRSKAINPDDLNAGCIWILMDISERKRHELTLLLHQEALEQRVAERTRELQTVVASLHHEIEERKLAEEQIRHLALHDALTGLPNRSCFEQRLAQQIEQAKVEGHRLAVLFIDLDRFKHINDSLGHHEGDQLLRTLAARLRQAVGADNLLARMGGDEFVVIQQPVSDFQPIEQLIERIQQGLQPPLRAGTHEFSISSSIGVALYPDHGATPQALVRHADTAMYRAKANGRNRYHFYHPQLDREEMERIELRSALYQALGTGEFELHYQPQVEVLSNRIVGVEALIRWHRPGKGMVSPASFIPLAEESGMINEIGRWVLESACAQLQQWQQAGLDLRVAVNLSAAQLDDPGFYDHLQSCLRQHDLQPQQLELELTESILMKQVDPTIELLNRLDRLGVHLSIDDFGTGYSSLSYLKRFPLDTLKIDQSFVRDLCSDQDDAVICRTIISMANNLNLTVTAEGVEAPDQLAKLAEFGCDLYQGYLFSRPLPATEITHLCREHRPAEVGAYSI